MSTEYVNTGPKRAGAKRSGSSSNKGQAPPPPPPTGPRPPAENASHTQPNSTQAKLPPQNSTASAKSGVKLRKKSSNSSTSTAGSSIPATGPEPATTTAEVSGAAKTKAIPEVIPEQGEDDKQGEVNVAFSDDSDNESKKTEKTEVPEEDPDEREDDGTKKEEKKPWDPFREIKVDPTLYSWEACFVVSKKILKVFFIVVVLGLILGCVVLSKLGLLFITSNMNPATSFSTELRLQTCNTSNVSYISNLPVGLHECNVPVCMVEEKGGYDEVQAVHRSVRWIWAMVLCLGTPYLVVFIRCVRKILFKSKRAPTCGILMLVLFSETCNTVGLMTLMFLVLPKLDVTRATLLMTGTAFLPAFLRLFIKSADNTSCTGLKFILDIFALLAQLSALVFLPLYGELKEEPQTESHIQCSPHYVPARKYLGLEENMVTLWPVIVSLFLISFSHWENFVDEKHYLYGLGHWLYGVKKSIHATRTKIMAISSLYKMVLTFSLAFGYFALMFPHYSSPDASGLGQLFNASNFVIADCEGAFKHDWLVVWAVQAGACLLAFFTADVAVKGSVQIATLTMGTFLGTPTTLAFLYWACVGCSTGILWNYPTPYYWNCYSGFEDWTAIFVDRWSWFGIIWWVSQVWITRYMWRPKIERLAKMDHIFMNPGYCGGLFEQSLILGRRRNDREIGLADAPTIKLKKISQHVPMDEDPVFRKESDDITKLFLCATMWHETSDEMVQILKSILRLDKHQRTKRLAKEFFKVKDPDYYEFEGHIFFDDAFEPHKLDEKSFEVNRFVKEFTKQIKVASFSLHGKQYDDLWVPMKFSTPYGGRMVYELPGGNKLIVHLKDKMKIRHRKRWSQVMYMRYFLGHRLWAGVKGKAKRKDILANNTYLLALDGDVDFKPEAVQLLVDLMKRNHKVGAACGRIHPIGAGPMVWYQKFEYAISHWLQKSTEHVLGCVLCSPGCFSLFRASALMDDNVLQTYSKEADGPVQHMQYDQGEDRWLCTLLLQQGHRVEYAAAADALTYAPEGFNEFFNQRRRWTPSTMANILDLLKSGSETVKKNENISMLYMVYQGILFGTSILGPATIFLLIVGALETALLKEVNIMVSFTIVFIPVILFFIVAMTQKNDTQLQFAAVLAGLTAVVQMVVLVSLILTITEEGLCHPATWMIMFVLFTFVLASILHPQEASCILHIPLYFIMIPTMYLILIIFSLCNLNNISWGTREVVKTTSEKEKEQEITADLKTKQQKGKPAAEEAGLSQLLSSMGASTGHDSHASNNCSCGSFCSLACCLAPGKSAQDEKMELIDQKLTVIGDHLVKLSKGDYDTPGRNSVLGMPEDKRLSRLSSIKAEPNPDYFEEEAVEAPLWIEREELGEGDVGDLSPYETEFWKDLIERYLYPIDLDLEKKERIESELKELRNKAVLAFFMIDAIFIVLVQTLQVADVNIQWNCTAPISGDIKTVTMEPIGLTFIFIFGIVMIVQIVGMLLHRLFSLLHIVSSTSLSVSFGGDIDAKAEMQQANKNGISVQDAERLVKVLDKEEESDMSDTRSIMSDNTSIAGDLGTLDPEHDWKTDDEMPAKEPTLISRRLTRKLPKSTANDADKKFAKKFVALHELASEMPEPDYDELPQRGILKRLRRTLRPTHRHPTMSQDSERGMYENSPARGQGVRFKRRQTKLEKDVNKLRHNPAARQILEDDSMANEIRTKYGISHREIDRQKRQLKKNNMFLPQSGTSYMNSRDRRSADINMDMMTYSNANIHV